MSAAERLSERVATFPAGKDQEARYLRDLEALLRERNAVGEMTLTLWGSRQKPPVLGTEAERLMNLLVKQGLATCSRRDINAPLVWRLSSKAKRPEAQAPSREAKSRLSSAEKPSTTPASPRTQASPPPAKALVPPKAPPRSSEPQGPSTIRRRAAPPTPSPALPETLPEPPGALAPSAEQEAPVATPEPPTPSLTLPPGIEEATVPTVPASALPDSQRPPSSFPPPVPPSEEPVLVVGDAAPEAARSPAPPAPPAPLAVAPPASTPPGSATHDPPTLPALAPSPADLLRSVPPAGPILPPRLETSPTAPSPTPPPDEEVTLDQITSGAVLKLGLSLRDRERLGQQLIAIGQLLRGDLKPSLGLQGLSESTARVYQAMTSTPELPSTIARRLGMENQQVSNAIKTLSLRSLVVRAAYGLWRLA